MKEGGNEEWPMQRPEEGKGFVRLWKQKAAGVAAAVGAGRWCCEKGLMGGKQRQTGPQGLYQGS